MRVGPWLLVGLVVLAFGAASAGAQPAPTRRSVLFPMVGAAAATPTPFDEKSAGAATATAIASLPVLDAPSGPGVVDLLSSPPAPGQLVEVDAFFAGADPRTMRKGRPLPSHIVPCPDLPASMLTDRPFPTSYHVLNAWAPNMPAEDSPWLAAITPDVASPGSHRFTNLPYHARVRGRFGDPRVAHCPRQDRVFLVEAIVALYPTQPPAMPAPFYTTMLGHTTWSRHHDPGLGLSLAVPPGWGVEPLGEPSILGGATLRSPEWPSYPVSLRVVAGETSPTGVVGSRYEQGTVSAWEPTQGLVGWSTFQSFPTERRRTVLFHAGGRTHELAIRYPTGYDLAQPLLTAYTAIVDGFALDQSPGPTPTPRGPTPTPGPTSTPAG